jgi:membrane protein DedA with SNARE-associated domain
MHAFGHMLGPWITAYGSIAVAALVLLESIGFPLPGETALVSAAIYAGTTHRLDIAAIIAAAVFGAVVGGTIGYWIGRRAGYPAARRFGARIGLTERRLLAGQYLFANHGGKIVLFGRFFAVLRTLAALLAGLNVMPWKRFIAIQTVACIVWALIYGVTAYVFGNRIMHIAGPVGAALLAALVVGLIVFGVFLHRHGERIERIAALRERQARRHRHGVAREHVPR